MIAQGNFDCAGMPEEQIRHHDTGQDAYLGSHPATWKANRSDRSLPDEWRSNRSSTAHHLQRACPDERDNRAAAVDLPIENALPAAPRSSL